MFLQLRAPLYHLSKNPLLYNSGVLLNNLQQHQALFEQKARNMNLSLLIPQTYCTQRETNKSPARQKEIEEKGKQLKDKVQARELKEKKTEAKISKTSRFVDVILFAPWKIARELRHYYTGLKLLLRNINICSQLVFKIVSGDKLSRRERDILQTTVADIFRLVPFLIIVIVPFLEFTLPVLIKLFPGMLPSTFETTDQKKKKQKQQLKVKIEMAKFFQQCTANLIRDSHKEEASEEDFLEFVQKIRMGLPVSNKEIIRFAKVFKEEFALENISHDQLQSMCRFFGLASFGPRYYLIYQLERKFQTLRKDDKLLQAEGMDSLTLEDLVQANHARGMKVEGRSKETLRKQLQEWLSLALEEDIPPFLLLLSRSLVMTRDPNIAMTAEVVEEALKNMSPEMLQTLAERLPDETDLLKKKLEKLDQEIKQSRRENELLSENQLSYYLEQDPVQELEELKKEAMSEAQFDDEAMKRIRRKLDSLINNIGRAIEELEKKR
eukprot:TRINITY_DN3190_c0_g2_i1.p1 TRINITY_DN3190_c0_g2~~TRINITY_DN3190_c0_g2_i1.p1  ORF type:complete len:495 (-),score=122.94 TRINITY_DN3190_c0_g2_i1:61-1545(-)